MKTALVCIAKNEDNYIDEWIKYHTKLGFDFIYVYQNDWRYQGDKSQFNNVHWLEFDGKTKQLESYQNFINHHFDEYDWVAFFDVDEFLCIPNMLLKQYLNMMDNHYGIGINWKLFGNNNLNFIGDYNVLSRFTKCQLKCNKHIKTLLHFSKLNSFKNQLKFQDPHSISLSMQHDMIVSSNGKYFIHGPFNCNYDDNIVLNHYFCKTIEEYKNKINRGRADSPAILTLDKYNEHNFNEITNTICKNFYESNNV